MKTIIVTLKSGKQDTFIERGRAGGSYGIKRKYEGGFLIITDEWENETAYPAENIVRVDVKQ